MSRKPNECVSRMPSVLYNVAHAVSSDVVGLASACITSEDDFRDKMAHTSACERSALGSPGLEPRTGRGTASTVVHELLVVGEVMQQSSALFGERAAPTQTGNASSRPPTAVLGTSNSLFLPPPSAGDTMCAFSHASSVLRSVLCTS